MTDTPGFIPYFHQVTPLSEIGMMNIGSRPQKRKPAGGLDTLRAIPWIFSFTQMRLHLPVWLGFEEAIIQMKNQGRINCLKEMYTEWPFFRATVDLIQMVLAKAEGRISGMLSKLDPKTFYYTDYYSQILVDDENKHVSKYLCERLDMCVKGILEISNIKTLLEHDPVVQRTIAARIPFTNALNLIQVEVLKQLRDGDERMSNEKKAILEDVMVVSIQGIASGMGNTG